METQLATDSNLSGLDLLFKEELLTDKNIRLKVSGVFSSVTGLRSYIGSLHKFVHRGRPLSRTTRNEYRINKPSLKLGAGLTYASDLATSDVLASLTARKQFQVQQETWLKFMTKADYDVQAQNISGLGRVQLTRNIFGFTETQDLRLRIGYEALVDQKGNVAGRPFGQIRENNWSLNTNFAGWWGVRYDL